MNLATALLIAGLLVPLVARVAPRVGPGVAVWATAAALLVGAVADAANLRVVADLAAVAGKLQVLAPAGPEPVARLLLLAALVWCGPAADVVVRRVLAATGVRVPATGDGPGAGRWIGRLERWLLLLAIAAGQAALAVIAIGGKALFRYAEVVADARASQPRLERPDAATTPPRDTLVDYVIVGSLASWMQAIALGVLIAS